MKGKLPTFDKIGAWSHLGLWVQQFKKRCPDIAKGKSFLDISVYYYSKVSMEQIRHDIKTYHNEFGYSRYFINRYVNEY